MNFTELTFALSILTSLIHINSFPLFGRNSNAGEPLLHDKEGTYHSYRRNQEINDEYEVTWDINLGGKEFLLESPFLKAGLEQSIKEFINNQVQCETDFDPNAVSFYSVEIFDNQDTGTKNKKGISGSGKCKGNRTRCKRKVKQSISDAGKNATNLVNVSTSKRGFCGEFSNKTIFDSFRQILITASHFNYAVDVDVTNKLGDLKLNYNVTFVEARGDGLDQIEDVDLKVDEPIEYIANCTESQCLTQNLVMRNIYNHFGIAYDISKHECLYPGVNCDKDNLVTYIWMVNKGLTKSIPDLFGSLPSLKGLFLGNNQLVGTIPSNLGSLRKLKMLWLQENALTGTIPPRIGNLRGLIQLNLYQNQLNGTIPTTLGKMKNLELLNLGRNALTGSIPTFSTVVVNEPDSNGTNVQDCNLFSTVFSKLRLKWTETLTPNNATSIIALSNLKILSLYDNRLSGTIPTELGRLSTLEDFSLANNSLIGEIPTKIGDLFNLKVLDIRGNSLSGSIPGEIANPRQMKVLNIDGNRLEKPLPSTLGKLTDLKELVVGNNKISGSIPSDFGNMRSLHYFSISGNKMRGIIPSELGQLKSLKNLDIRDYAIESKGEGIGTIPSELGNLVEWKYIVFANNGLTGALPSELGGLESAEILWLKDQKLSGAIPTDLGKLKSLAQLSLGNNSLKGPIPTALGSLNRLATFDIGKNDLNGIIPREIASNTKLKYVSLDNLNVTGNIPSEFGNLTSLQYLNLGNNTLNGQLPSEFGELKSLEILTLDNNTLTGLIPTQIGNLVQLQSLDLGDNKLSGTIPSEIGTIKVLSNCSLGGNKLSGTIPIEIAEIESLALIDLGENDLTGVIPSEFGQASGLKELKIGENKLNGTIPTQIGSITALQQLDVGGNNLDGAIPTQIGSLSNLTILSVGDNQLTGQIPSEIGNVKSLQVIDVGENELSGEIPSELGSLALLESFDAGENKLNGTIPAEFGNVTAIKIVNLGGNNITGGIPTEVKNLTQLIIFNITQTNVTEDRFLCKLEDFDPEQYPNLDCNNYCGTEDQQCVADDVGNASCADIDCNGGGMPTCTDLCTLNYSSCNADTDELKLEMTVQTEERGTRTNWIVTEADETVFKINRYRNFETNTTLRCFQRECYEFTISNTEDTSGDQVIQYSLRVNGEIIGQTNPNRIGQRRHDFGLCTAAPQPQKTTFPSIYPSLKPSHDPSQNPSKIPTMTPSTKPSIMPSTIPTLVSSKSPSVLPSVQPSIRPSIFNSTRPTLQPSHMPSKIPSASPSEVPSSNPLLTPSLIPSGVPTLLPSPAPSMIPSLLESATPSGKPSILPSTLPSSKPSLISQLPSILSSLSPSIVPSSRPSLAPSIFSSTMPSSLPSMQPSTVPSQTPSLFPSFVPTLLSSLAPSEILSISPSIQRSTEPSIFPTLKPSSTPSLVSSLLPSIMPTVLPSLAPSAVPTIKPTTVPSSMPSITPSTLPSTQPSIQPNQPPSIQPSQEPSIIPSSMPSIEPSTLPSSEPSIQPSQSLSIAPSIFSSAVPSSLRPSASNEPSVSMLPSLTISPTSFPSIVPSIIVCDSEQFHMRFMISTDNWGNENTWRLTDTNGNIVESGGPYTKGVKQLYGVIECIDWGCYTFTLLDSYGDGIFYPGYFQLYIDHNLDFQGRSFNFEVAYSFCLDPSAPSSNPSTLPSIAPSTEIFCDVNEYELNHTTCTQCPGNHIAPPGSTDISDCIECPDGTFLSSPTAPTCTISEEFDPHIDTSTGWRIWAPSFHTVFGWKVDVKNIKMFSASDCSGTEVFINGTFVESGNAGSDWGPNNAFQPGGVWGGRTDEFGFFYIGLIFDEITTVRCIRIEFEEAYMTELRVQALVGSEWENVWIAQNVSDGVTNVGVGRPDLITCIHNQYNLNNICTQCPGNHIAPPGSTDISDCTECPDGTFLSSPTAPTCTISEEFDPHIDTSTGWRIWAPSFHTVFGWEVDVKNIKMFSASDCSGTEVFINGTFVESGNAGSGWGPNNAFQPGGVWGGRTDEFGFFYIGVILNSDAVVYCIRIEFEEAYMTELRVQALVGSEWKNVFIQYDITETVINVTGWDKMQEDAPSLAPSIAPTHFPTYITPSSFPSLTPSMDSTSLPTLSSAKTCVANEFYLFLRLRTDSFPQEISWDITDTNGTIVAYDGNYTSTYHEYDLCFLMGCYVFTIRDSYGDGIFDGLDRGYFLYIDRRLLLQGREFDFEKSHPFCEN